MNVVVVLIYWWLSPSAGQPALSLGDCIVTIFTCHDDCIHLFRPYGDCIHLLHPFLSSTLKLYISFLFHRLFLTFLAQFPSRPTLWMTSYTRTHFSIPASLYYCLCCVFDNKKVKEFIFEFVYCILLYGIVFIKINLEYISNIVRKS